MSNPEKAAEFPSDAHRRNHVLALKREAEGYDAKAKGCETAGDDAGSERYKGRATQARAELRRIGDSAQPRRGATRAT